MAVANLRQVLTGPYDHHETPRAILMALTDVYGSAMALAPAPEPSENNIDDFFTVDELEVGELRKRVAELFGNRGLYGMVYDPCIAYIEGTQPDLVCGDLSDDLGDIYRDLIPALRAYESDPQRWGADVHWEWASGCFGVHWGVHLQHATTALHFIVHDHGVPRTDHHDRPR